MNVPKAIPKKYRKHIATWDDERDSDNGIIVTLRGLSVDSASPTHVFGEDSIPAVISTLRSTSVCRCPECQ